MTTMVMLTPQQSQALDEVRRAARAYFQTRQGWNAGDSPEVTAVISRASALAVPREAVERAINGVLAEFVC